MNRPVGRVKEFRRGTVGEYRHLSLSVLNQVLVGLG
jgi:hypothetical protein